MNRKYESAEVDPTPSTNAPVPVSDQAGFWTFSWCAIPWGVGGRIGLLFTVLCLIKLVMLAGFGRHLFEIHWRTDTPHHNWMNGVVFFVFAVLVGLNLWQLGTRCQAGGARTVRAANAGVLALGALFIFLTFHTMNKNYLYEVMNGTLTWWDLRWYLMQAFFFQPPFLVVWLLIYA